MSDSFSGSRDYFYSKGLDIFHPFEGNSPLKKVLGDFSVGVIIGNSKSIWPNFIASLKKEPKLLELEDPFDNYIESVFSEYYFTENEKIFFTHYEYDEFSGYVPFVKLANEVGLSKLMKNNLLCHPVYGLWFALRGLILFNGPMDIEKVEAASFDISREIELNDYLARTESNHYSTDVDDLIRKRREFPMGQEHAYSPAQVMYHYTKDKKILIKEIS